MEEINFEVCPMAIPSMALLQQNDAQRSGGSMGGAKGAIAPLDGRRPQKNCNASNVSSAHKTRNFCYICLSKTFPQF